MFKCVWCVFGNWRNGLTLFTEILSLNLDDSRNFVLLKMLVNNGDDLTLVI